ncbi:uncharacterized protein BO96DRAFT_334419 [Aspergillus niger CBS 101883]|uniref:Uncharacterized protein n=2 Tax=Aspergillus niger TaxID=5061 RepID=A2QNX6_ASPNC|nr:uncharacterized protein BO96DRAFT_334419 [Aspergillus niger CBS 101883]XP_059606922.1 hypothetical protein An07g07360 [Aspergillus niger]PYH57688.1 hypothetical protein BO96DRAFT_334419 [Aspergillus niger CBS 101883]CAL00778.1 hypothetical protein An07g07360 [Aspergillus niger]
MKSEWLRGKSRDKERETEGESEAQSQEDLSSILGYRGWTYNEVVVVVYKTKGTSGVARGKGSGKEEQEGKGRERSGWENRQNLAKASSLLNPLTSTAEGRGNRQTIRFESTPRLNGVQRLANPASSEACLLFPPQQRRGIRFIPATSSGFLLVLPTGTTGDGRLSYMDHFCTPSTIGPSFS